MASFGKPDCIEITSEVKLVCGDLRVASNEVDPRWDILSNMIPVKADVDLDISSNKDTQM